MPLVLLPHFLCMSMLTDPESMAETTPLSSRSLTPTSTCVLVCLFVSLICSSPSIKRPLHTATLETLPARLTLISLGKFPRSSSFNQLH